MSTNQTGHVQNLVNLGVVINHLGTFQKNYNPPRNILTIDGLTQLKSDGESVLASVTSAEISCKNSISARSSSFDNLDNLITRAINGLRISGAPAQTIVQAETIVRQLRGKRATAKTTGKEAVTANESGAEIVQNTLHNTTMDSKIENFTKFVQFLSGILEYKPNEADLTITALNAKLADLKTTNASYVTAMAALDAARLERNTILYAENSGVVDVAMSVKLYVKSLFGARSPQYKEISDIVFTKKR